ncbi:MAG: hypothetical protein AAFO06_24110 [Cyanobacteria bacterium J06597_16]
MSTLEAVSETVRALSPEQQQKVLEYAQLLQQETCHPKSSGSLGIAVDGATFSV